MHKIKYKINLEDGKKLFKVDCVLELLNENAPYEAVVHAHGHYYQFIYGKYQNGYYISIPDWYIGCPMADYRDVYWNKESLIQAGLSRNDAEIITRAVSYLKEALDTDITEYKQLNVFEA